MMLLFTGGCGFDKTRTPPINLLIKKISMYFLNFNKNSKLNAYISFFFNLSNIVKINNYYYYIKIKYTKYIKSSILNILYFSSEVRV